MEEKFEEGIIKGSLDSIPIEKLEKILEQMKQCICKIYGKKIGTGFFCKILFKDKLVPVLMTNYHIIDDDFIENNKQIKISIDESHKLINIDNSNKIYSHEKNKYDIMIIKLKEGEVNNFLELDENIFNNNSEYLYEDDSIYVLHYPNGSKASVSFGNGIKTFNNFDIKHKCNTGTGSSGAPILNLSTNKILGIHKGFVKSNSENTNIGTFLKFPLNELNTNNQQEIRPLTQKDYDNIFVRGIGLINLGNTDFINSALQALIHCKLFIHSFLDKRFEFNKEKTPISYNFLLMCISLLDVELNPSEKYIDISYFIQAFIKNHPFINKDAQMFYRLFLEDLNNELNDVNIYNNLIIPEGNAKIIADFQFDFNFKNKNNSIITDIFYSQIIKIFICQCGSEIYTFQKILDLPLLIPENINKIDIYELINIYFNKEVVNMEYICENCHKIINGGTRMKKLSRPPEVLIISLQRINSISQKKNECLVTFPDILSLYDFIDHDIGFDKESYYQLFAIVNHQGNINSGHYFTYIKPLGRKNWYVFDDFQVKKIIIVKGIFPYSYSLFYIKKKYG